MDLRRSSPAALLALIGACTGDVPTGPAELGSTLDPDGAFVGSPGAGSGEAIVARASGAAHREAEGKPIILNFSAVKRTDGSVTGSYVYHSVFNHVKIHVDVTCMTVTEGNKAWIAGIITQSSIDGLVGTVSYFYAFDNGEGAGAEPDIVSLVRANDVAGEDQVFCRELPTALPAREVVRGSVNVSG